MFPNPQSALPLPLRPDLEQYRKLAKDLVKACKSGETDAAGGWAARWTERLAASHTGDLRAEVEHQSEQVIEFARRTISERQHERGACALADVQFVIARSHGFESWPKFAKHVDSLARTRSPVARFELGAEAIVTGEVATLQQLLRDDPALMRARSTREHRATLLHYVSANGVEGYRQVTPKSIVRIAEILLEAGAEVDAEADVYGGGCTTLGLVATSAHPRKAGVQNDLIDVLLKHGARLDHPRAAGNHVVLGALANGCPEAAAYLASRGATLDLAGAAGVGRLDVVKTFFNDDGTLKTNGTDTQMKTGFSWACAYGHADVVEFLLQRGMAVDAWLRTHGKGHTGLHVAAFGGQVEVVEVLSRHGAPLDVIDETWSTSPLVWALHAWGEESMGPPERYYEVVAMLVAAGATVKPGCLEYHKVRADSKMHAALTGRMNAE